MAVEIAVETPLQDDVRALLDELNEAMNAQGPDIPDEFKFRMTVEEMAGPETTLWVARRQGEAVGCGALLRHRAGLAEVKRMYVRPGMQGQGIAGRILNAIEDRAAAEGVTRLVLETGAPYFPARRVYERAGFTLCGPFADYPDTPYSVFYEKTPGLQSAA